MSTAALPLWAMAGTGEDWREYALCATLLTPDAWFPPRGPDPGRAARAVCAACPVTAECLEYALDHGIREGIFGGLGEGDRRQLGRRRAARFRMCLNDLHVMTPGNTYTYPNGVKSCRACRAASHLRRVQRSRDRKQRDEEAA